MFDIYQKFKMEKLSQAGSFVKGQTSDISSENEWQWMTESENEWQQMTMSGKASDNKWQRVTASDKER